LWPKKWPSRKNWKRLPEVLSIREKFIFALLFVVFIISTFFLLHSFYIENTTAIPVKGGTYKEGIMGSPQWLVLNPIYVSRSDAERDAIEILFSGLMSYKEGKLSPELAKEYQTEDQRVYDVRLKDDIFWSDGERITAEDVIFTVETIQNPSFKSSLQEQWDGVRAEKLSQTEVRFTLDSPSSIFLQNLTLKPIPKHIWENISANDFLFSSYNSTNIVSSGPYKQKDTTESSSGKVDRITLERNDKYYGKEPYIDNIELIFFDDRDELVTAKKDGKIDGFAVSGRGEDHSFSRHVFTIPRYFAVLFNMQKDSILKEKSVRQALNYATDKEEIIKNINGEKIHSPLLLDLYKMKGKDNPYPYDPQKAKEILKEEGFEDGKKLLKEAVPFKIEEDLSEGDQGEEVRALQRCLMSPEVDIYQGEVTGFFDEETKDAVIQFQETHSEDILDPWGFESGIGRVARTTKEKLMEVCPDASEEVLTLKVKLHIVDEQSMINVAEKIKEQWAKIGVEVDIIKKDLHSLNNNVVRPREYESVLFGIALTGTQNPFPLWHSSKIESPGLNLSGYKSETADSLIEEIITSGGEEETFLELEEEIVREAPGVFLYRPDLSYYISSKIKGVEGSFVADSSERFHDIENWYIDTKRRF